MAPLLDRKPINNLQGHGVDRRPRRVARVVDLQLPICRAVRLAGCREGHPRWLHPEVGRETGAATDAVKDMDGSGWVDVVALRGLATSGRPGAVIGVHVPTQPHVDPVCSQWAATSNLSEPPR